ncbi:hypothetical protein BCF44_106128 [Kutzneria buriramensis]|uniref:Uncharacterized protein n=1 Tax=Kutzneria buriramensis TaxID=1045776 RepID=A0A3E0HKF9_9PSEU|nr:hypothetical protein [Kutzneria buriramensis]REH46964.1 hypothetical protein BCF44_106128 [Kutzneria buriramensis]
MTGADLILLLDKGKLSRAPDWVTVAFHELATVWLPGNLPLTVQELIGAVPLLVTVTLAWKQPGQLLVVDSLAVPPPGGVVVDEDGGVVVVVPPPPLPVV